MKPYGIKSERGISLASDFATACTLDAGQYSGKSFRGSTIISGRTLSASIAAESHDVAWRLFRAFLKAERIKGVTQITIQPIN